MKSFKNYINEGIISGRGGAADKKEMLKNVVMRSLSEIFSIKNSQISINNDSILLECEEIQLKDNTSDDDFKDKYNFKLPIHLRCDYVVVSNRNITDLSCLSMFESVTINWQGVFTITYSDRLQTLKGCPAINGNLCLHSCHSLVDISDIPTQSNIRNIELNSCKNITKLFSEQCFAQEIHSIEIYSLPNLVNFWKLPDKVQSLTIGETGIKTTKGFPKQVGYINIRGNKDLTDFKFFPKKYSDSIIITDCDSIKNLPAIKLEYLPKKSYELFRENNNGEFYISDINKEVNIKSVEANEVTLVNCKLKNLQGIYNDRGIHKLLLQHVRIGEYKLDSKVDILLSDEYDNKMLTQAGVNIKQYIER